MNNIVCPKCGEERSRNKAVKVCHNCGVNFAKYALLLHRQELQKTINNGRVETRKGIEESELSSDLRISLYILSISLIYSAVLSFIALVYPQLSLKMGRPMLILPAINIFLYLAAVYYFAKSKASGLFIKLLVTAMLCLSISSGYGLYVSYHLIEAGQKLIEASEKLKQRLEQIPR